MLTTFADQIRGHRKEHKDNKHPNVQKAYNTAFVATATEHFAKEALMMGMCCLVIELQHKTHDLHDAVTHDANLLAYVASYLVSD